MTGDPNISEPTPSDKVVPSKADNYASSITDFSDSLGKIYYHIMTNIHKIIPHPKS